MSMTWWGITSRSLHRWSARARQYRHRTVTGVLGGTAVVLFAVGADQHLAHAQHLWMAAGLPFALAAVGRQVWRPPEEGLPDALRLRLRSRRIALRAGSVPGFGASVGLVVHLGAHGALARDAGFLSLWAVAVAPVPVLVESALWRFAPRELRLRVRTGQLAEAVRELNANVPQVSPLALDPDRGYAGTPVARQSLAPAARLGAPYEVRPSTQRANVMAGLADFGRAQRVWLREASLHWNGATLTLRDGRGTVVAIPLHPTSSPVRSPWSDLPVELVLLREQSAGELGWQTRILLLDASGRRLLTMPGLGFVDKHVARLATSCGLVFTGQCWAEAPRELPWRHLWARAYPRHRGHIRLRLGHRL